ncbi:MAG: hypothetical protein KBC02_01040 [Candidatus Pacebacteria bacterium]|nr:hypothetical protein [Candidatus Paceibacterota bacterium]
MLLFPLVGSVEEYLTFLQRGARPADAAELFVAAIGLAMWIGIGMLLYEEKPRA